MIVVSPTQDNRYIVVKPFRVNESLVIPKGYKTNGADIPRIFWCIVPPFKPKYLTAVIIHDWLCDKDKYKEADDLFEEYLFKVEYSWKTRAMVKAVRLYHWIRYGVR